MQKLIVMVVVLLSACTDDTVVPPALVELGSASSCRVDEDCCAAFHPCSTTYVAVDRSQVRDANALADIANVGQGCSRCATTQPLPVCSDGTCQLVAIEPDGDDAFTLERIAGFVSCRGPDIVTPASAPEAVVGCGG